MKILECYDFGPPHFWGLGPNSTRMGLFTDLLGHLFIAEFSVVFHRRRAVGAAAEPSLGYENFDSTSMKNRTILVVMLCATARYSPARARAVSNTIVRLENVNENFASVFQTCRGIDCGRCLSLNSGHGSAIVVRPL